MNQEELNNLLSEVQATFSDAEEAARLLGIEMDLLQEYYMTNYNHKLLTGLFNDLTNARRLFKVLMNNLINEVIDEPMLIGNLFIYDIRDAARVRVWYIYEDGTLQLLDEDGEYIFMHISLVDRFEIKE